MLWIAGANGLVGKALQQAAKAPYLATGRQEADLSDLASLRAFVKKHPGIRYIVNSAAFSLVDLAEFEKEEASRTNALGPENLGIIAREIKADLLHLSTDYVFSGNGRQQLTEEDPVGPLNHYGMTKLEGEQRLQKVMPSATILRTSWVFGRGGKNFVAKSLQLLQAQKEILLVDDQWGRPTFAPDLAAVILQMQGQSGLYHFANEGVVTKYGFGLAVKEEALALGIPMENETILPIPSANFPSPCKRPAYTPLDTSKIEKKLGLTPRSWRECLREYLVDYAPVAPAR